VAQLSTLASIMKACGTLALTSLLLVLASGCVGERLTDISARRVEVGASTSGSITSTNAVELFQDVARQLGFAVEGPVLQPRGHESVIQYTARAHQGGPTGYLNIYIVKDGVSFYCVSDDFTKARKMASLFEQSLDKQGVRYTVSTRTENPLN